LSTSCFSQMGGSLSPWTSPLLTPLYVKIICPRFDLRRLCFFFRRRWKINLSDLSLSAKALSQDLPALLVT
jgi:hypothetical protein